jgi:hypothetical protein
VITPSADAYIGVAAFCATNAPNGGNRVISVSNADGGEQTRVWLASTTELRVSRLDGTQLATYTIPTSVQNRWVYYEVYFKIADSGGRCLVKMDGVTVIDFTGDTKNAGTSTNVAMVNFGGTGGSTASFIDDVYVCDGLGSRNNTFLGEVRVLPMVTTGAGSSTQFTPTSGSNWDTVNDTGTDTTYNSSFTPGQRDTYNVTDVSVATVVGVQTSTRVKKLDVGSGLIKPAIKSGSTVAYGTTQSALSTAYTYLDLWETDPNTSAAWTQSAINALEIGAEIVAAAPTVPAAVATWTVTETSGTTVADSIGGVTLTLSGSPTPSFVASQLHGHSVLQTTSGGSSMAIDLAGGGTAPEPSTAITVMCWVRTSTSVPSTFANAMSKATSGYDTYSLFTHYGAQNTPACQFNTTTTINGEIIASSALLADHAWHHLAETYDGTTVKLYCDGTQVGSATTSGTLVYSPTDRFAVMGNDHFGNYFVGDAAEFKIFNVALTQAQITAAMAG